MWGMKENMIDIPYDVITSVKLEKRLFTSAIRLEAPALVGSRKLGMSKGENDIERVIDVTQRERLKTCFS